MHGYTKAIPIDTDPNLTLDSDQVAASQKATKAYADAVLQTANNVASFNLANALSFERREVLNSARTYYVRTDGNDANNGLADSPAGAFRTIQRAVDGVSILDIGLYTVTIYVRAGSFAENVVLKNPLGAGSVVLYGDETTPSNVVVSPVSGDCFLATTSMVGPVSFTVTGFKVIGAVYGLRILNGATVKLGVMDYGACTAGHLVASISSKVLFLSSYTISGDAPRHIFARFGSFIGFGQGGSAIVATLSGSRTFSTAFVVIDSLATLTPGSGWSYTGTATGKRYEVASNGAILNGGSTTYFPGTVAGTTATGGQYL